MTQAEFHAWMQKQSRLPGGFERWEPKVWWIPVSDLCREKSPRWSEDVDVPFQDFERMERIRTRAANFTWQEFRKWLEAPPFKPPQYKIFEPIQNDEKPKAKSK